MGAMPRVRVGHVSSLLCKHLRPTTHGITNGDTRSRDCFVSQSGEKFVLSRQILRVGLRELSGN